MPMAMAPPAMSVRGPIRASSHPQTGPATNSATTNGATAIVASRGSDPWMTMKNWGTWSIGTACANPTTTPITSATATARRSRRIARSAGPASTAEPERGRDGEHADDHEADPERIEPDAQLQDGRGDRDHPEGEERHPDDDRPMVR